MCKVFSGLASLKSYFTLTLQNCNTIIFYYRFVLRLIKKEITSDLWLPDYMLVLWLAQELLAACKCEVFSLPLMKFIVIVYSLLNLT